MNKSELEAKIAHELKLARSSAENGSVMTMKLCVQSAEKYITFSDNYDTHQKEIHEIKLICYKKALKRAKQNLKRHEKGDPSLYWLTKRNIVKYQNIIDQLEK